MVPMLEVINDPTFPAIIMDIKVGANSKITDCLVANPTKYFGISGLFILRAVWIVTTPPTKKEIKATMPKDPITKSSMSFRISCFITDHLVGFRNISEIIKK
jgi:hypothetical protein